LPYFSVFIRISHFLVARRYPSVGSDHHSSVFWALVSFQGWDAAIEQPRLTCFFLSNQTQGIPRTTDTSVSSVVLWTQTRQSPECYIVSDDPFNENNFQASGSGVVGCAVPLPCTLSALLVTHGITLKNAPVDQPCVSPRPPTPFPPLSACSKCPVRLKSGRNKASGD
jgi:hypothetical protein